MAHSARYLRGHAPAPGPWCRRAGTDRVV